MKKFKINEFLTLKLEDGKTNIYVNGELFDMCKYLMLNIPIENPERFDEIESIDEAADILGWTNERQKGVEYDIDPETEFWGHCSNLQVWYEHDYDTRILHSYLAFPLLKKLTDVRDPLARRVFKGEIVKRLESGYTTVIELIFQESYLDYFNRAELKPIFPVILTSLNKLPGEPEDIIDSGHPFLKLIKKKGGIIGLLEIIDKLQENYKIAAFFEVLSLIETSGLKAECYSACLEIIDERDEENRHKKHTVVDLLIMLMKKAGVKRENYLTKVNSIYKFNEEDWYLAFYDVTRVIKKSGSFPKFLITIDKLAYDFMNEMKKSKERYKKLLYGPSKKYKELSKEQAERRRPLESINSRNYKSLDKF